MNLKELIKKVTNKENFVTIDDYSSFCKFYLEFTIDGLQAKIISRNENNYMFYQYGKDGLFAITRLINSNLMLSFDEFEDAQNIFTNSIKNINAQTGTTNKRSHWVGNSGDSSTNKTGYMTLKELNAQSDNSVAADKSSYLSYLQAVVIGVCSGKKQTF